MAFRVPNFNLNANVWRATHHVSAPPDVVCMCNLTPGKRVMQSNVFDLGVPMEVLLTAHQDVRPEQEFNPASTDGDCMEIPAGSGRYYWIVGVDDVAKGFSNEYRLAMALLLTTYVRSSVFSNNPWNCPALPLPLP